MQRTSRIATVAFAAVLTLVNNAAQGGGEYQGFEPLPSIVDIRFNQHAIGFATTDNSFVPGGPRYFELSRGASDWQRLSRDEFVARFPSRLLPSAHQVKEGRFNILTTSDGEHFIATDYQCMEGSAHWAGLRKDGDWVNTYARQCVNISAVESSGSYLYFGTSLVGEAGMFYGAQGVMVVDRETGELKKRIGYSKSLNEGGMVTELRRDPFTGDVWAGTLNGLWRITPELELGSRYWFADQFDPERQQTFTHLAATPDTNDPLAQYVRAMNISEPRIVYDVLKAQCNESEYRDCGFNHMYNLYMSSSTAWSRIPGAEGLLPFVLGAAANGPDGDLNHFFIEELASFEHACLRDTSDLGYYDKNRNAVFSRVIDCFKASGIEPVEPQVTGKVEPLPRELPLVPASSIFRAPPREAFLRLVDGQPAWSRVHAAWFAWQGGINGEGEYVYTRRCVDFDTVEAGDDGYYRFDARTFRRDGDWVGAENRYAIESDEYQEQSLYRESPPYFDLPPSRAVPSSGAPNTPAERLALECRQDGVQSELITQLLARVEKQKAVQAERVAAARAEVHRRSQAAEQQRVQNMVLTPEISVEAVRYDSDDPRILEFYRKHGLELPKPARKNPLIEQMRKEKEAAEERRKTREEKENE